jgi:hypothetical protein
LKLTDYLPESQVSAMRAHLNLESNLMNQNPFKNDASLAPTESMQFERGHRDYLQTFLENPDRLYNDGYAPRDGVFACGPLNMTESSALQMIEDFESGNHPASHADHLLNRIAFDNSIQSGPGVHFGIDPIIRFMVEGLEGITERKRSTNPIFFCSVI